MADLEDVTLDGRPLQSLRVADLKAALEERGLSKSGQKNALIKRLKGALMLENLQRTSTAHVGLQPNSQIGEEMSQNSFIKQYLAKQQELLRQRLEREAREAYDTNEQEDHTDVNNSTSCPPQAQEATAALAEQHKPPGPSSGEGLFGAVNEGEANRNQEAASGSVAVRVPGGEHLPEKGFASNDVAADSDDDDSEDGEEDGDDDDWESGARRRSHREPARAPTSRERSGASCQPPQQHMPSLLSPQLRQPTPPPSPPPELSFPLPDTPKQSPPSPDVAPARRSSSTSSSGSSSSGSRSSSPEPQRSGHAERKPGPLTLLARKMESEGAFSGAGWHRGGGEGGIQDSSSTATSFPGRGPPEGLVSAIAHTTNTAGNVSFPTIPGTNQGITGGHLANIQVPVSVLKATATEERVRERDSELEREKALELERQEKQRQLEQEQAIKEEREKALALEREERERVLEKERIERQQALEREEREKALQRERELALERERQERELAVAKEREERERALELERQKELERQRALEQERLQREKEREEMERARELERAMVLEQERRERERALEQERLQRERALEAEIKEKERIEREKALERERLERERLEREKVLEQERLERERALEKERLEREKALEQERLERERAKALEQERLERERIEREKALERERQEQERLEREKALERERLERERLEREKTLERERLEREKALERERLEQERLEREKALERERLEREKALERERLEQERLEREKALERERKEKERVLEQERIEKALEQERIEKEKAVEQERLEQERALEQLRELERKEKVRIEKEKALEQERIEKEKALQREREEKERLDREAALEQERKEKERAEKERLEREKALEQEKLEREKAMEKERKEKERALERERLEKEKAMQREKEEQERALEQEKERARVAEKERESHLPPSKRGREIGLTPLPTPPPLSTGPGKKSSTEAGEQEGVHAPVSQSDAAESIASMSPQSSFKKFRFLRDSPIQLQSSPSMVIKRPRNFSDTLQPWAVSSVTDVEEQPQAGPRSSTKQEDTQMRLKQEAVARTPGSVEAQPEKTIVGTTLVPSPKKEGGTSSASEDKEKADLVKSDQAAKESAKKANPVDTVQQRGRDTKKEEKQARQRSSSNDSSSSESDSGSSSASSSSSTSSQEKTCSTSRSRREGKPGRDSSPHDRVTLKAQAEGVKETPKASPYKRAISVEKSNTTADGDSHTKKSLIEAPTREESQRKRKDTEGDEETDKQRQVKETTMAEPEKLPETSEETPKAFSARKISISSSKSSPGTGSAEGDQDSGATAGRKRRWGSSTAVNAKKPSISITTDSLKSLIPDIRPCLGQEAVVDLHPEEAVLSGAEDEERECSDQDLQIRRTVTQVVHSESQENGQKEAKRSRHEELEVDDSQGDIERTGAHEEKMNTSFPETTETQSPSHTSNDVEISTVTPSDTLIRRSISQQKTGVSITIDDPVRTARQPSPPRGKVSSIVHISNLVRPFTLGQLKELLSRSGTMVEEGFWIDKIKSHCYVTYCSPEEAAATRAALHGVKWPQSNPKVLSVDFCQQDELDFHKGLGAGDKPGAEQPGSGRGRASGLPSLLPERDQWAEREREMERREKARAEREWDRDKVKEFGKPEEEKEGGLQRSHSRERRRKERGKSKEKKTEKKEKTAEDPPAKLLDDLFRKTKAAPCIYWLPLTEEQFVQREAARAERMKEREKRRKEQDEEEEKKKREEERKERTKAAGGPTAERSEGEKEKEKERERERDRDRDRGRDRERERERENDKRRDGYRRPEGRGAGGGRRSRSRSDPRERRR